MIPSLPQEQKIPEPRRIRGLNRIGVWTLIMREISRFLVVPLQTIVAPVITTLLFYAIFALAFGGQTRMIGDIHFMEFLAPGLITMTMVQNAFANTSSSIMISKFQGNIVDTLMPPLSSFELLIGLTAGGVARGMAVGLATTVVVSLFLPLHIHSFAAAFGYALLGSFLLSSLGIAAGIWAEKFDHIASVTNFVITPLTFLSGTFYSIGDLPGMWHGLALYNPFFYMIDGFRYGFTGQAGGSLAVGVTILVTANVALAVLILWMLRSGYKLKT
jgi:ABC-2 type transport system permease protein